MTDAEFSAGGSFEHHLERVPAAFAVTRGVEHTLVYANAAFRRLAVVEQGRLGRPISEAVTGGDASGLIAVLDRAIRVGAVERDRRIEPTDPGAPAWCCTVWPESGREGQPGHLVIELRLATEAEATLAFQRDVAERMLLSALRERDIADSAEASRQRATFLAAEGRRLAGSLDEETTLDAMTRLALPSLGAWCIVDILEGDGAMRRLAIIHPDPAKQALLRELESRWSPEPGDLFGGPASLRSGRPTVIAGADVDAALAANARDPETMRVLRHVGVGSLLTVPLVVREELVGAITFVAGQGARTYTPDDVVLAEDLAIRSAMALDSARIHGEAMALRAKAESASEAKSAFLRTMSHELRTPLNAIAGYVDLIDMGLRGPVSEAQHADLARIRSNQKHLLGLVSDVLNLARIGSGQAVYSIGDVIMRETLAAVVTLVEPLIPQKQLVLGEMSCDPAIVARADAERVTQIIVNLLSNAIKFTQSGGRLNVECEMTESTVLVHVADTGVGIPADKLATIFEPFVQLRDGLGAGGSGVGLGLAISRDLARAMGGDLTVRSEPGTGSTFTLSLPRAEPGATSREA